ncbi:hypothetical protein PRIPAC_87951 [Pristionchus pacificus]|uniref:Uncharacterized protein n=1 Tax=Pristionchus pacificus TaxID=54126 RepID=A0A2A6CTG4_PRIPA|nr:hypothetical protein PRIPAC_87951 [Pristionchus pacificus]|eukprot:PDM81439.1 hypothetical protein PRIPAC_35315 [Pristionchus pacificus]
MLAAAAVLAAFFGIADSVLCDNCLLYNGQQCVSYGTCQGTYCLYEYAQQRANGQTMLKKSCVNTPNVQFDDGTQLTVYNQCVTKTTNQQSYIVKLCYNADYCNRQCDNPQPLQGLGTQVTCYSCSANNGQDCNSGSCMGLYCTYSLQRQSNGQSRLMKGCSDVPQIPLDDGTVMTQLNTCQTKNSMTGSTYNAMICNTNYCNAYCTPGGNEGNPQRDPTITCNSCEMTNAYDCTGGTCQGTYCIYERSTPSNGVPYVKRSCSFTNYAIFPDNTPTQTINQCERKTVNGVSYAIEVCNSGSFCDTQCNSFKELSTALSIIFISIFCLLNL